MTSAKFCPQCGAGLLPGDSAGVCPRCAFRVALEADPPGSNFTTHAAGWGAGGRKSSSDPGFVPPKPHQLAQHFPHLEILDLIGQGGMGAVYKARQKGLDRIVALKILPPHLAQDPAFEARFAREAQALAKLSHPNIVTVYDSGQVGGLFYFLMEYVDGVNLRQALKAGQLTPQQSLAIVPQVCDALQYAHDEGIVHRDIKPENVLIDRKSRVKIADFGLARLLGSSQDNLTLTGTQQVMGTPRYMAPEQLEGTHDVDHRADIYSLGVVFYEMLTGELPLGRFAPPSKKVQVDIRLDEVVLRTLEKEPGLRYQQAGEIKTAVQSIVGPMEMPRHLHAYYGREYRSRIQIFGVPLFHFATGIDPTTHKRRIAKGIIAMGDQAIGVIAVGGAAFGLFALGGMAIGAISCGGLSLGLVLATGGGAFGLGLAFGGLAVAPIAVGGCAVGYYAAGGAAFAVHPFAANAKDAAGEAFFRGSTGWLIRSVPALVIAVLALPFIAMLAHAVVSMFQGVQETQDPSKPALRKEGKRFAEVMALGCFACFTLFLLLVIAPVALLLFAYQGFAQHQVNGPVRGAPPAFTEPASVDRVITTVTPESSSTSHAPVISRQQNLNWTDVGPELAPWLADDLDMEPREVQDLNKILQETFRGYLDVERTQSSYTVMSQRQSTTIRIRPEEIEVLQQQFWSKLETVLDPWQRTLLEKNLPLTPQRSAGAIQQPVEEFVLPGLFGWGSETAQVDVFPSGGGLLWHIRCQGLSHEGRMDANSLRWKRFFREPGSS